MEIRNQALVEFLLFRILAQQRAQGGEEGLIPHLLWLPPLLLLLGISSVCSRADPLPVVGSDCSRGPAKLPTRSSAGSEAEHGDP